MKKLRCCVGGEKKRMFGLSTELKSEGKLATVKRFVLTFQALVIHSNEGLTLETLAL